MLYAVGGCHPLNQTLFGVIAIAAMADCRSCDHVRLIFLFEQSVQADSASIILINGIYFLILRRVAIDNVINLR
jgi:hypothetical protein